MIIFELIVLYISLPLIIYLQWLDKPYIRLLLLFTLIYMLIILYRDKNFTINRLWHWNGVEHLKVILLRFVIAAIFLTSFTLYFYPELFLRFPTERPQIWLLVMVLYPILSAYPQEIIFRVFFFQRCNHFFSNISLLIFINAILFGWMHIFLGNWIAVIFSFIGGLIFAHTYHKTNSVLLTTIEHALYGNFLFTIGLGWFFYHGNQ